MKFKDLKLPAILKEYEFNLARGIYNQMHAHYEAKLAEANMCQQPALEWRLPDPPPGQQWHRDDWTQDMLVDAEGNQYRPLLLGEDMQMGDERLMDGTWETKTTNCDWVFENADEFHFPGRTRRPLP